MKNFTQKLFIFFLILILIPILFLSIIFPAKVYSQTCTDSGELTVEPCLPDASKALVSWPNGSCGEKTYYVVAWCPSWITDYWNCYNINHVQDLTTKSFTISNLAKNNNYRVYVWTYHGSSGSPNRSEAIFTQNCSLTPSPSSTPTSFLQPSPTTACFPPNKPVKTSPSKNQVFSLINGSLTIDFKFHDGDNTGCYPHQTYFGLIKDSKINLDSGWLTEDKYLIKSPYQEISYSKTIYEDGVYIYRARSRNKKLVMGPYDDNPYYICVDSVAPNKPQKDKLSCNYNKLTQKFDLIYSWEKPADEGCSGLNDFPYWAQISKKTNFSSVLNYNNWDKKTSIKLTNLEAGDVFFAHVKSRDKANNQSDWTEIKSLTINCQNCGDCLVLTPTILPSPINTPNPITETPAPSFIPTQPFSPTPTLTLGDICTPYSVTCPKKTMGDANCDCQVNKTDKENWLKEYEKTIKGSAADLKCDFNNDKKVDLLDYGILRKNYGS